MDQDTFRLDDVARLLLVEDDDDFAEVILAVLAAPGRELTRVTGLASARDVLVSEPVDLVLLDLGLADGDGRQLLHELSRLPVDVRPEVHVLTARLEPALQAECVVLGAAGVHRKPIDTGALVTVLAMRIAVLLERRMERLYDHETGLLNPQGLAARWAARTFDGDEVASCLFLTGSGGGASPEHVHRLVDATLLATQCADLVARIAPDVVFVMLDGAADRDIEVVVQSLEAEWYRRGDAPTRGGELICELIQVFGAMPLRTVLSVGQLRLSASRSLSERVAQELDAMFGEPAMDDCAQG